MQEYIIELSWATARFGGHCFSILQSNTVRSSNSSGTTGVYRRGDKYAAKIVIAGKQIQLGIFPTAEEAAEARTAINAHISKNIIPAYTSWKYTASLDPEWADQNPFHIHIIQRKGQLPKITCNFPIH